LSTNLYLFLTSFLSLFLELLLIRWVPSQVRVIAYYGNLMLLSSFLGLGCGAMLARRGLKLGRFFAPLLCALVLMVTSLSGIKFQQGPDELRFLFAAGTSSTTLPIVAIFSLNALLFVPLGELIGVYFSQIPPLRAYSWDIGGAITGTALFGLFSYTWFSPILGFVLVMAGFLIFLTQRQQIISAAILFSMTLVVLIVRSEGGGIWSPYNLITIREVEANGRLKPVSAPQDNVGALQDPPLYVVQVNGDFYMMNGTIDPRRYTNARSTGGLNEQYTLPHKIHPGAKDILVVGSGGGVDVEAALLAGARSVDALEIDPVIIRLGRQFNPSQSYNDPRVTVFNTDARPYFRQTGKAYDMIVFGFLDSQSLFSQMSSIRLDGYVYTRESFQEAFKLLRPGGLMSVSFFSGGHLWLLDRLIAMVRSASGTNPLIFTRPSGQAILLAPKEFSPQEPSDLQFYRRIQRTPRETEEALDDWPYLYLRARSIPADYLATIGFLFLISAIFVFATFDRRTRGLDFHFFFLGAGFLLLETKSITTISLFFGATWLVSMVVILGVLVMVLLANLVASRLKGFTPWLYVPLMASIGFLYFCPVAAVLDWPFYAQLTYCLLLIPLPIFFAGLIFSLGFRSHRDPSFAFGSNLLGAMVGGFVEYVGMVSGTRVLLLVILVFYLASFLTRLRVAVSSVNLGFR
jgi:SAM-dependent methyltransferase